MGHNLDSDLSVSLWRIKRMLTTEEKYPILWFTEVNPERGTKD